MGNFFTHINEHNNNYSNEYPYLPEGWIAEEEWEMPENAEEHVLHMEGPMNEWRFMPTRLIRTLKRHC